MREALTSTVARPRAPRPPTYGPRIIAALERCWAVLRLGTLLPVLVPPLRRDSEIDLTDDEAALLCRMRAATVDRRLARQRASG